MVETFGESMVHSNNLCNRETFTLGMGMHTLFRETSPVPEMCTCMVVDIWTYLGHGGCA
jgi:hypothetical protein